MHSFLVTGKNQSTVDQIVSDLINKKNSTDISYLKPTDGKYHLKEIKELIRSLKFSSSDQENGKIVVIENIDLLNTESANAFLKTLENPPGNTTIIMTAKDKDLVIDTILSRSQIIENFDQNEENLIKSNIDKNFIKFTLGEKLKLIEKIKDREGAIQFCDSLTIYLRNILIENPQNTNSEKIIKFLEYTISTKEYLKSNINTKIALGNLILQNL